MKGKQHQDKEPNQIQCYIEKIVGENDHAGDHRTGNNDDGAPDLSLSFLRKLTENPVKQESLYERKAAGEISKNRNLENNYLEWKREGEQVKYTFTIPANTKARIQLPGQEELVTGSGTYSFTI